MSAPDPSIPPSRFDPDDLLRHGRFVKALARELASGDDAEELAARAMAAAVEQQPASGPGLRAWFRRVVVRLFHREARGAARRARRDLAAAHEPAFAREPPATVDLVARLELERRVAIAFARLAEPYRSTLFLRYFDDLPPKEIARLREVPVETVKTRLKRGLAHLRRELDEESGLRRQEKRDDWRATAIALAGPKAPTLALVKSKGAVAAALLLLLGSGAIWRFQAPAARAAASDATADPALAAEDGPDPATIAPASAPASSPASANWSERRVDESELPIASGVVVDEAGAPIPEVAVLASRIFPSRRTRHGLEYGHEPIDPRAPAKDLLATTDRNGRFALRAVPRDLASLCFVKRGYEAAEWFDLSPDFRENADHRVELKRGRSVRGRVVDTSGRPLAAAWVTAVALPVPRTAEHRVARLAEGSPSYWAGLSQWQIGVEPDGSFALDSLPRKSFGLSVDCHGYRGSRVRDAELEEPLDVTLVRNCAILDVVDAATRAPLADAMAMAGGAGERGEALPGQHLIRTRESEPRAIGERFGPLRGQLLLWIGRSLGNLLGDPLLTSGRARLVVFAPGHLSRTLDLDLDEKLEPPRLLVELVPGTDEVSLAGTVSGAERPTIAVHALEGDAVDPRYCVARIIPGSNGSDGRFAIRGLPPARYRLFVTAKGRTPRWLDVTAPARELAIDLAPSASLEVVAVDRTGAPQAGWRIHAQSIDGARAWQARTNDEGVALLDELPDGRLAVGVFRDEFPANPDEPARPIPASCYEDDELVTLVAGERRRLQLRIPEPVAATLHARHRDGSPVAGAKFRWCGCTSFSAPAIPDDDPLRTAELVADERGEVRFAAFPGRHCFAGTKGPQRFSCDARITRDGPNEFTAIVPDYSGLGSIRGRLTELGSDLLITGRPIRVTTLVADGSDGASTFGFTDMAGEFRVRDLPAGPCRIDACAVARDGDAGGTDEASRPYRPASRIVEIVSDEELSLELQVARAGAPPPGAETVELTVAVVDDESDAALANARVAIVGVDPDTDYDLATVKTDAEGRARLRVAATEHYQLEVRGPEGARETESDAEFEPLELTALPLDGVASVEVRLTRRR